MRKSLTGLIKLANLEKSATNITRLLSRVGTDLSGATDRDLKFLSRRGFKGFTPEQVNAARARGFLPTESQELAGFNRGTANMLRDADVAFSDNPTHGFGLVTDTNTGKSTAHIPQIRTDASISEQEIRSSLGRHEAREFVRSSARRRREPYDMMLELQRRGEIGTSHQPGVIYDERVFRSQLANRLGMGIAWNELPLDLSSKTKRGPRDTYIGSKPLKFEYDLIRKWNSMKADQQRNMTSMARVVMPEMENWLEKDTNAIMAEIRKRTGKDIISHDEITDFVRRSSMGDDSLDSTIYSLPDDIRQLIFDLQGRYSRVLSEAVYDRYGIDPDRVSSVIGGYGAVIPPEGSDLAKVMGLSIYPTRIKDTNNMTKRWPSSLLSKIKQLYRTIAQPVMG